MRWFLFFSVFTLSLQVVASNSPADSYAVLIDAGSTGSRAHVYRVHREAGALLPEISLLAQHKINPGISSLTGQVKQIEAHLKELLTFAAQQLGPLQEPGAKTPLWFQATGGMRALGADVQASILRDVRMVLGQTSYELKRVEVISGATEGVYQWLTVNYLQGNFSSPGGPTTGVFEMGGASLQIAFVPKELATRHTLPLTIGNHTYALYTYSYDGFGQGSALKSWGGGACDKGRYKLCKAQIAKEVLRPCDAKEGCGLIGVAQPKTIGPFVGIDNFRLLANATGFKKLSSQKLDALGAKLCAVGKKSKIRGRLNPCFDLAYTSLILEGPGHGMSLQVPHQIKETPISWTLGALLAEFVSLPLAG